MTGLTDGKTERVAALISEIQSKPIEKLLVVGCGDGIEAAILSEHVGAQVIGIDPEDHFDPGAAQAADLRVGDAMNVDLPDESIDVVYSYHALEHISDPRRALAEMARVLKPGGHFWIGTPNRHRAIGYIGAKEGTLGQKFRWNAADWRARLAGRFRNEYGAHAGFSRRELREMLTSVFRTVDDRTADYFRAVYPQHRSAVNVLAASRLSEVVFPSVYFSGTK
jgi:ubiquinone/menaquinone biosynthesis C-methylase UbiE